MPDLSVLGGALGTARREGRTKDVEILERELATERLIRSARKILAQSPPLTEEQIGRIVKTLGGAV